ncbi:hypothetical protein H0H81_010729 [Sphagnurus paluster]|uniref:Uncharacterized protein n=1 Tax=Sphagnurus paluster TaxID=117069 RepID=A0A9P7FSR9_9AGAR|nr:hypothetical protein H0H81_010729 [Sphagnurus paluster]
MDSSQTAPCACLPLFDSSPNPSKRCKPNSKCKPYSPPLTGSMPSDPGYVAAEDPLALALAPPPDETPEARAVRELAEAEAKRVSDGIDEQLKREREAERKKKRPVKLLLLGQSESGKTATLKSASLFSTLTLNLTLACPPGNADFQLTYARREWSAERPTWRAVVQLNLVRNATAILHILAKEMGSVHPYPPSNSNSTSSSYTNGPPSPASSTSSLAPRRAPALPPLHFSAIHRALQTRLAPLHAVQAALERKLGEGATELYSTTVSEAAPFGEGKDGAGGGGKEWIGMGMGSRKRRALQEFSINSTNGWKSALEKFRTIKRRRPGVDGDGEGEGGEGEEEREEDEDPGEVLESVREDIKVLWEDPVITEMLHRRKVRMEDSPGFFLNDTERVASRAYAPTDDDVVRARLRTLGVQEYRFIFDHGRTAGTEWHLYDVGGTRSSRVAWYPYFDDSEFASPQSPPPPSGLRRTLYSALCQALSVLD